MNGKTDEEILAERKVAIKAAEELLREPVEVIDSFFQSAPVGAKPLWFLGKSLELLSGADIAYFAKDWQKARGCKIEHECAVEYTQLARMLFRLLQMDFQASISLCHISDGIGKVDL